jgi:hypothetical protein
MATVTCGGHILPTTAIGVRAAHKIFPLLSEAVMPAANSWSVSRMHSRRRVKSTVQNNTNAQSSTENSWLLQLVWPLAWRRLFS